jgi:hypothetical protein
MTIIIGEMFAKKKDFENQNTPPLLMYPTLYNHPWSMMG